MSTGSGKTEVFAHLPEYMKDKLPGRTLVLVHRDILAQQAYKKITQRNPLLNVNIEAGGLYANEEADVIIASVQTLGRRNNTRIDRFLDKGYDKFIVDEAHRSIADSYYNIYNKFNILQDGDNRLLLGVTATPLRGDGQGLGALYQKIAFNYPLRQAIEEGYLVDVKGFRIDTQTSLDSVHVKTGDFDTNELAEAVNNSYRNRIVATAYLKYAHPRHTIGFGVNIEHSQALASEFKSQGINAEAVWGADINRHRKIEDFKNGKIKVLFSAQLLNEGFDVPEISCVILAAPTKSGVVFSQRVGRGTRLCESKKDCLILDICDNSTRHSLITLPTLLGLSNKINLNGGSLLSAAKIVEETAKEYPHIDFSILKDIDKIQTFIEEVNLFEPKILPEVEENSEFVWHIAPTGGYVLLLPNENIVTIKENLLDKWTIHATLNNQKYKGERPTMSEAFSAADELVRTHAAEYLKIIKRDASWHDGPASEGQIKFIKKLYKGRAIPNNLSKGAASKLIGQALAGKGRFYGRRK